MHGRRYLDRASGTCSQDAYRQTEPLGLLIQAGDRDTTSTIHHGGGGGGGGGSWGDSFN